MPEYITAQKPLNDTKSRQMQGIRMEMHNFEKHIDN